jgi:hypothetical protein
VGVAASADLAQPPLLSVSPSLFSQGYLLCYW